MGIKFRYIFLFAFIICFFQSFSQVNDAALWFSTNAEKKITPALTATLSEEFRLNENITELGTFFTDAGVKYKFNKLVRVSVNYRFVNKRYTDDFYSKRHRYYFDLTIREKVKPFVFQFRTRFQSQYADIFSSNEGKIPSYYSRNKFTVKLDFDKKVMPYFYTELYTPLNDPGSVYYLDNVRYCAGIEYKINLIHSLDIYYMLQREYHVNNPETDYIIGVGYNVIF